MELQGLSPHPSKVGLAGHSPTGKLIGRSIYLQLGLEPFITLLTVAVTYIRPVRGL